MELIFDGVKGAGVLDYVTAWYIKAAQYMQGYNVIASDAKQSDINQSRICFHQFYFTR